MRTAIFILVLVVAATAARAQRVEVVWEQRFDVSALDESEWQFEGAAGLRWGRPWTKSDPEGPVFNGVHVLREEPTPTAQGPRAQSGDWPGHPFPGSIPIPPAVPQTQPYAN